MMFRSLLLLSICLTASLGAQDDFGMARPDESGVRAVIAGFAKAWNKHDPKAMASFWEERGDLIDPWGKQGTSRAAIESIFIGDQQGRFKSSTMTQTVNRVRFLEPNVALVDVSARLSGAKDADGEYVPTIDHHVFWVLHKQGDSWKIAAGRPYQFLPQAK